MRDNAAVHQRDAKVRFGKQEAATNGRIRTCFAPQYVDEINGLSRMAQASARPSAVRTIL
jgi:hypothetical protein